MNSMIDADWYWGQWVDSRVEDQSGRRAIWLPEATSPGPVDGHGWWSLGLHTSRSFLRVAMLARECSTSDVEQYHFPWLGTDHEGLLLRHASVVQTCVAGQSSGKQREGHHRRRQPCESAVHIRLGRCRGSRQRRC